MKNINCTVIYGFHHKGKSYAKGDPIELNEQDAQKLIKDGMIKEASEKKPSKASKKED